MPLGEFNRDILANLLKPGTAPLRDNGAMHRSKFDRGMIEMGQK
jgi:hypothetical protein